MLKIWITLAPREESTIEQCVSSIRKQWYKEDIYVFCEPWAEVPKNMGLVEIQNKRQLWCMGNYHNALSWMYEKFFGAHIRIMQDDMVMCEDLQLIEDFFSVKWDNAVLNTFHNSRKEYEHRTYYKKWFNVCTDSWYLWWASFVMSTKVVLKLLKNHFYRNHLYTYEKNKQVDAAVGKSLEIEDISIRTHNPSIVKHIGSHSTIWHNDLMVNTQANAITAPLSAWVIYSWDEEKFRIFIENIAYQFDKIYISWDNIPKINIPYEKVDESFLPWFWQHEGHYFLLSDKIIYPPEYSKKLLMYIRKNKYQSIVTVWWANVWVWEDVNIDCTHYSSKGGRCNYIYDETFCIPSQMTIQVDSRERLNEGLQEANIPIFMVPRKWGWMKTQYSFTSYPHIPSFVWRQIYWLK